MAFYQIFEGDKYIGILFARDSLDAIDLSKTLLSSQIKNKAAIKAVKL